MLKGKLASTAFFAPPARRYPCRRFRKLLGSRPATITFGGCFERCGTGSFKLVHIYTICYRAKNADGEEAHGRVGRVAAIPRRTQRKQCPAPCFRHAWSPDECVLQRRHRRTCDL